MLRSVILLALLSMSCRQEETMAIVFGGDVMLDRTIRKEIDKSGVNDVVGGIADVLKATDFTIVNLECPVTDIHAPVTKKFVFRGDPAWLPALRKLNVTHCILANNHSYDQGREGLVSTAENLSANHISPVGFGESQHEACAPVILEKGSVKVAIFSSVMLPLEGWMYLEDRAGMCQATVDDLVESITAFKKEDPLIPVIVTLHWGVEYQRYPTAIQEAQAQRIIHAGADAIIGHHPHVVQSFQRIEGKPVFYSIGNLIFDNPDPKTQKGVMVKLTFGADQQVEIIPYRSDGGRPVLMNDEEEQAMRKYLQSISDSLP